VSVSGFGVWERSEREDKIEAEDGYVNRGSVHERRVATGRDTARLSGERE
jgi:hypothetical protein